MFERLALCLVAVFGCDKYRDPPQGDPFEVEHVAKLQKELDPDALAASVKRRSGDDFIAKRYSVPVREAETTCDDDGLQVRYVPGASQLQLTFRRLGAVKLAVESVRLNRTQVHQFAADAGWWRLAIVSDDQKEASHLIKVRMRDHANLFGRPKLALTVDARGRWGKRVSENKYDVLRWKPPRFRIELGLGSAGSVDEIRELAVAARRAAAESYVLSTLSGTARDLGRSKNNPQAVALVERYRQLSTAGRDEEQRTTAAFTEATRAIEELALEVSCK